MNSKEVTYKEFHHPISTSDSTTSKANLIAVIRKAFSIMQKKDKVKQASKTDKIAYYCWKGDSMLIGHLADYPDYWTQGEDFVDLENNLRGLYNDIKNGVLVQDS